MEEGLDELVDDFVVRSVISIMSRDFLSLRKGLVYNELPLIWTPEIRPLQRPPLYCGQLASSNCTPEMMYCGHFKLYKSTPEMRPPSTPIL